MSGSYLVILTVICHFVNRQARIPRHETDDTEDDKTSKDTSPAIDAGNHDGISVKWQEISKEKQC